MGYLPLERRVLQVCDTCRRATVRDDGGYDCLGPDDTVEAWRKEQAPGGMLSPDANGCPGYGPKGQAFLKRRD